MSFIANGICIMRLWQPLFAAVVSQLTPLHALVQPSAPTKEWAPIERTPADIGTTWATVLRTLTTTTVLQRAIKSNPAKLCGVLLSCSLASLLFRLRSSCAFKSLAFVMAFNITSGSYWVFACGNAPGEGLPKTAGPCHKCTQHMLTIGGHVTDFPRVS